MKKIALLSLILGATLFAVEKTTVEFALTGVTYVNNKEVKLDIAKLNKTLAKQGLEGLPEIIVVSQNAKAYWRVLMKRIEAANKVAATEMTFPINSGYYYEFPELCYRGKTEEVVGVLDGMLGSFLNDGQGVMAYRHGETQVVRVDDFKSEKALKDRYGDENENEVKAWLKYKKTSKSVLVMSDLGAQGDGTELYATSVKPCK